ncbi:hypothetical protein [Piscibacillus halophilus]|uniref:hypothetical protein n=1 Tax=Piscibacillus halophilus TaxID=571933 RepID=UPI00240947BB|nr:hypothetical protein [Piscibacillus halophilus]
MNNTITKEQYQTLKETGLNFETIAKRYLTESEIKAIPFQKVLSLKPEEGGSYANYSSFAYWKDQPKLKAHEEAAANIELLQDWDKLQAENATLRSGFVLLGVNAGAKGIDLKAAEGTETLDHFEMFQVRSIQSGERRQGIPSPIKYKNALMQNEGDKEFYNQVVSGTYMTDFIKGFPTSYGPDIKKAMNAAIDKLNYNKTQGEEFYNNFCKLFGEILKNELDVLGGKTHTLVVMGKNPKQNIVNDFLRRSGLDKEFKIVNISHYSGSPSSKGLAEELKEAFKTEQR